MNMRRIFVLSITMLLPALFARGGVGDPQLMTDHPWYPGELACSTFERLQATQAAAFRRMTGREVATEEDRVIASWLWRNTHYAHGEPGAEDYWGKGFAKNGESSREYWTGLFAHGFALCGTTHAQWIGEMQALLGHNRARVVGTTGHNSFEVFLSGGNYGPGRWVLLDHDLSTVIYNDDGSALLSIADLVGDHRRLTDRSYKPQRQHGWLVCGLHPDDGGVYDSFRSAEYFAGYSGPPPSVHLRRGETLRRYFEPGLEDGRTFVFWGRNYNTAKIAGPERSLTWVNQPEKMHGSTTGAGHHPGQARYGNAVYTYQPDFTTDAYKEGLVAEQTNRGELVFEFQTPYVIAAAPPDDATWGIYQPGCTRGLTIEGSGPATISLSTDRGASWHMAGKLQGVLDLTDHVKGRHQYWLKLTLTDTAELPDTRLKITTVCQTNAAILPRLKDNVTQVSFAASGSAITSAGPGLPQARPHVVAGGFDTPRVTLELAAPRGAPIEAIYAAAQVRSSNPPREEVAYRIEYSTDRGRSWQPLVEDWRITRRGVEPDDFWSQSFCWGSKRFDSPAAGPVQARFSNNGGKSYARAELHVARRVPRADATEIAYAWTDASGPHEHIQIVPAGDNNRRASYQIPTGDKVRTRWVQMRPVAR